MLGFGGFNSKTGVSQCYLNMLGFGGFNTGVSQCYLNMLGSGGLLKHRCFTVLFKHAESGGLSTGVSQYYLNMLSLEVLAQVFHSTI